MFATCTHCTWQLHLPCLDLLSVESESGSTTWFFGFFYGCTGMRGQASLIRLLGEVPILLVMFLAGRPPLAGITE